MSRRVLTDRFIRTAKPGFYSDAAMPTLNIRVQPTGSKQWVQRLFIRGRAHRLGLGGYPFVSLAKARERASNNRELVQMGGKSPGPEKTAENTHIRRGGGNGDQHSFGRMERWRKI